MAGSRHRPASSSWLRLRRRLRLRLPRRSARLRLTALYGGFFVLSGSVLVAITYALFQRATAYRAPTLPTIPHAPTIRLRLVSPLGEALPRLEYVQHQLAKAQGPLALAQQPRRVVAPKGAFGLASIPRQLAQAQHQLAVARHQLAQAVHQIVQAGSVQAAQRAADSHQLLVNSGIALALAAVLALLAGWLVAGRILRPIRTITRTARRISSSSLHERLALDGPEDELKQLGDTLDGLLARLEAAFEAQRHFVANASHELRTPIARERTLVQVALGDPSTSDLWRSTGQALLASNREQETLIEALLALASSEGGLDHREPTDLADLCRTVLARPRPDTDRLGLGVEVALDPAPLEGDPRLVERLVANLVDNAIGHNVEGGHLRVSTAASGSEAVLQVLSTGPVVPPGEVARLFQPFQRLEGRRARHKGGHGLGLSIVGAIATAHGAAVTALALPGGGLSVEVAFPAPSLPDRPTYHPARPLAGVGIRRATRAAVADDAP